jgi:hypothetical protein
MMPQERRGKRLFLVLASLIILEKLIGTGLVLSGNWAEIKWWPSVGRPLVLVFMVLILWQGDTFYRWLVGLTCILSGLPLAVIAGRVIVATAEVTPPEATGFFMQIVGYPMGFLGLIGLCYMIVGLLFLVSPSLRAFFRHQREGPRFWTGEPIDEEREKG